MSITTSIKKVIAIIFMIVFAFALCGFAGMETLTIYATSQAETCVESECDGVYENGICSIENTHYQAPEKDEVSGYYKIGNAGNLMWFATEVNSNKQIEGSDTPEDTVDDVYTTSYCATLTANIDLTGVAYTPIGSYTTPYQGIFDGAKHSVTNLTLNVADQDSIGFFGAIKTGGVKNLTVEGTIQASNSVTQTYDRVGMLVGNIVDSAVYNCKAVGSITFSDTKEGYITIGGAIGRADHCVIINCASEVDINFECSGTRQLVIGGIVGSATVTGFVPECVLNSYSIGDITISGTPNQSGGQFYIGGIAGYLSDDAINNFYYGTITDNSADAADKKIGYAFGAVQPTFESSEHASAGQIIVSNNYYIEGNTAIGAAVEPNGTGATVIEYDISGMATALTEENFKATSGDQALVVLLNKNASVVEATIITHREELKASDSDWGEALVNRIYGDEMTVSEWSMGANGLLSLNFEGHEYQILTDETYHWLDCLTCDLADGEKELHYGGEATCSEQAKCTFCGSYYGELLKHEYDGEYSYDEEYHYDKCIVCDYVKQSSASKHSMTEWVNYNDDYHSRECIICSKGEMVAHEYSEVKNTDNESHTLNCECGNELTEPHSYETVIPVDENTHKQLCQCGDYLTSIHNFNDYVNVNDETHKHSCDCGEGIIENHAYGDWVVAEEATTKKEGKKIKTCICGSAITESISMIENNELSGGAIAGIVIGSVVVVGIANFAIFWFAVKKKKWSDLIKIFKK